MGRIITFYSYKGGTGRSMALANVAWILASAGHRVLAIDWDLEAPGLHRYFHPFLSDKELTGQESQGVIDMAVDFAVRSATPVQPGEERAGEWHEPYADFSKWRQQLRWPSGEAIRIGKGGRGEIDFVPAGRQGAEYAKRVNHFDWRRFYENLGGGAFFDTAKRKLDVYDYVLIDSRTGVSDTSGICTVQMPDTLVVCFTLNYQSIKGALAVAQSVREQRPNIRIFPLPTRVDPSEEKLLARMKNYAITLFAPLLDTKLNAQEYWFSMEVPYFARYAYAEKLALFEEQASITASTLPAMVRLSDYLTDGLVRSVGTLPGDERSSALAAFEETAEPAFSPSTEGTKRAPDEVSHLNLFISCARNDHDMGRAMAEALRAAHDNIVVFLDSGGFEVGGSWLEGIRAALDRADSLIVIDTSGGLDRDLGESQFGIGFFSARIQDEIERHRDSERQIICFYNRQPPASLRHLSGVDIGIEAADLRAGRAEYIRKSSGRNDGLARTFYEITDRAEKIVSSEDVPDTDKMAQRRARLTSEVIPTLRGRLFDSLSAREVQSLSTQVRIDFDLPPHVGEITSMPIDAELTLHAGASELFGTYLSENKITWQDLKNLSRDQSMLIDLEKVVIGALSQTSRPGGDQIIRSANGRSYNAVVSRRSDYYNGRKVVEIYFVEVAHGGAGRGNDISVILKLLRITENFRYAFGSNRDLLSDPTTNAVTARPLMRKLGQLHKELRALRLGEIQTGDNRLRTEAILNDVNGSYDRLEAAWREMLDAAQNSNDPGVAQQRWVDALERYRYSLDEIDALAIVLLEDLQKALGSAIDSTALNWSA